MLPRVAKRLSGEEARARILDAAEAHLRAEGPRGLRLDGIARSIGVSRQALLHHFGTRDALIAAVVNRALERLQRELAEKIGGWSEVDRGSGALLERVFEVVVDSGYGRLLGWLALEHEGGSLDHFAGDLRPIATLAQMSHAIREREVGPRDPRDTLFTFVLSTYAVLGSALFERGVLRSAGLEDDAGAPGEFRRWLADLIVAHLERRDDG
jgi:AcrR family transcriptional regulator